MSEEKFISEFNLKPLDLAKKFSGVRLPKLQIEDRYYSLLDIEKGCSNTDFLKALCRDGYRKLLKLGKINPEKKDIYAKRVLYEIEVLEKLNFVDYILMVWDVTNFCDENDIPHGPGRGSCAGALVCYFTGITDVDPIEYGLFFERFISPSRAKSQVIDGEVYLTGAVPDIDLDICFVNRHKVIEYLYEKYEGKTSKISNISTLTGKSLIKECGKSVSEKSEHEMNQVSKLVTTLFGNVQDISETYKENRDFREWCDENQESYNIALKLRNLVKNKSVHASGIVISPEDITQYTPLELTKEGELVSGFDMKDVGEICVKLDILGLKTLTVINDVLKMVGIKNIKDIDVHHPSIYAFLQEFENSYGIFQLEAGAAEKVTRMIKPQNLNEISAALAICRPGAMNYINQYVENKNKGYGDSIHPLFDDILKDSYQIPLFQEDLMMMLNKVGFSLEESYLALKIVGKKLVHEVKEWESKIKETSKNNGFPDDVGNTLWKILDASANYSFNRSHSTAYSKLAAITCYLKANHPKEFYLACLKMAIQEGDQSECIFRISNEMRSLGYKLLPPNLKHGNEDFILEDGGIRFGLKAIKGISESILSKLREFEGNYDNKFALFESVKQAKINIGVFSAMIQAGAIGMDNEDSRSKLVLEAQLWNLLTPKEKKYCLDNGKNFNYNLIEMVKDITSWIGENGKPITRESRLNTISKKYEPYKQIYKQNSQYEDFANWVYEKKILGFTYSKTLKDIFLPACKHLSSIEEFHKIEGNNTRVTLMGIIIEIVNGVSKKGKKKYTKYLIEDGTGLLTAFVFDGGKGETGKRTELKEKNRLPKEGDVAAFRGKKFEEILILDDISPQSEKVFVKLADMKNDKKEQEEFKYE